MATDQFSRELAVFREHRDDWVHMHPGMFVAIQDSVVADGFFENYAEALRAGLKKFGVERNFLVKQVWETEPVYFVS